MAFTLLDAAQNSETDLSRAIVTNIIETTPFMGSVPYQLAPSLRYEFSRENALPDTSFRALNSSYTATNGTFDRNTIHLMLLGGRTLIDRKLASIPTFERDSQLARQASMLSRAIALDWKKNMFNGDNTTNPTEPDGLKKIIANDLGAAQSVVVNGGTAATISTAGASNMVSVMNQAIDACISVPDMAFTNRNILSQLDALRLSTATNEEFANQFRYETVTIPTGTGASIRQRVGVYNGIMLFPVDDDSDGAEIMAFDETAGGSSVTSSIIFVKWGDGFAGALYDKPAPDTNTWEDANGINMNMDWGVATLVEHSRAVSRVTGILTA